MKKFIMGLLIGAMLALTLPVSAAIEEYILHKANYSLIINEADYTDEELPLLNYNGSTYAPVKSLLEAAGLDVAWDEETKQAVVTNPAVEPESEPETEKETTKPQEKEPADVSDKDDEMPQPSAPTQKESTKEPEPQQESEPEPEVGEPDTAAYEAELSSLTSAYNADIESIEREKHSALDKAISEYEASVYSLIQKGVNAQVDQMRINAITQGINGQYQQKKDARTAKYNSDVAALKAQYGI